MKKRINLLRYDTQVGAPKVVQQIQKYALAVGMVLFIVFLSINALFLLFKIRLNTYNREKISLMSKNLNDQDIEAQILYFTKKQNQLNAFIKEDSQFLPYYNLLKDLLKFSSNSPILESMRLDQTKSTDFVVSFLTFDQAFEFLHFVESDSFLNNFEELKLDKFVVADTGNVARKGYELRFHGKFKNINETNI